MKSRVIAVALLFALATPAFSQAASQKNLTVGGSRPVVVNLPADISKPSPLLIMLHSASTSGAHQERYMKLGPVAKKMGMIYIAPDGVAGSDGRRVWNAAKACCQRPDEKVDDIAYITSLIDEIAKKVPVDKSRIYMVGHSNGAFMSMTYACTTGAIAGVVSLAGAMDKDFACTSAHPFAFLQIHGSADKTIKFGGGVLNGFAYTGAKETIEQIAKVNMCSSATFDNTSLVRKDFEPSISGLETKVEELSRCRKPVVLWEISRGSHSPQLPSNFAAQVLTFLSQISKG